MTSSRLRFLSFLTLEAVFTQLRICMTPYLKSYTNSRIKIGQSNKLFARLPLYSSSTQSFLLSVQKSCVTTHGWSGPNIPYIKEPSLQDSSNRQITKVMSYKHYQPEKKRTENRSKIVHIYEPYNTCRVKCSETFPSRIIQCTYRNQKPR